MTSRLIIVSLLLLESLTQAQIHGGTTVDGEALAADVTTPGPGSDSSPGPGLDTTPGSGLDATPGSGLDTTPGSGLDTASGPGSDPAPGPGSDPAPGPVSDPAPGPVSEHSIAVTSMPNSEGNETMTTSEKSTVTTTERSRDTSDTSLASEAATVTPAIDTDDRQLDATTTQETVLLNVGSEIDTNDISSPSPHSSTIEPAVGDEEVEREPSFAEENTELVSTPSSSLNTISQEANTLPLDEEHSTDASLPDSSPEPVPDEDMTSLNASESFVSSSEVPPLIATTSTLPQTTPEELHISSSTAAPMNSTVTPSDASTTETEIHTISTLPHSTSTEPSPSSSGPVSTTVTADSSGGCFGEAEVNTVLVVAVVVAVNVLSVVVTAVCVHRIVSRRLSWDPPPVHYNRSKRAEQARQGGPRSGLDLASDTDCKASEGEGAPATNIPIIITNEDGWCVPYSEQDQKKKKGSPATEDTGV